MDCLVSPCSSMMKRRCAGSRHGYRPLEEDGEMANPVMVVVGKEKRVFLVDAFVLEEQPFRVLLEIMEKEREKINNKRKKKVIFVDVDAILFEHLLWLMNNDCSSLSQLNVREIVEFYAQDN